MWGVIAMCAIVFGMVMPTSFTKENHDDLTCHVIRGEQSSNNADEPQQTVVGKRVQQDFILRPKTSKRRNARNC